MSFMRAGSAFILGATVMTSAHALVLDFTGLPETQLGFYGYENQGFKVYSVHRVDGYPEAVFTNQGNGVTINPGNHLNIMQAQHDPSRPSTLNSFDIAMWWVGAPDAEPSSWSNVFVIDFYTFHGTMLRERYVGGVQGDPLRVVFNHGNIFQVAVRPDDARYAMSLSNIRWNESAVPPVSAVPEPSTYAMLAGGLGLMGWIARRKRKQSET